MPLSAKAGAAAVNLTLPITVAGGWTAWDPGVPLVVLTDPRRSLVEPVLDHARGWRLPELRKRREMTQEQVATRMGISIARVSQIESGDVSTQEVLSPYIAALGGTPEADR